MSDGKKVFIPCCLPFFSLAFRFVMFLFVLFPFVPFPSLYYYLALPSVLFPSFPLPTLESGINIRVRLLIFGFLNFFLRLFNFLFLWLCTKDSNYLLFKRGLRLFKGLCLLFLPNVPGATFIQGGMFIPDSRVNLF